jgi:HSP20 family protein
MFTSNFNNVLDRMLTLSRAMDEVGDSQGSSLTERPARRQLWLPPVDIYETETAFIIEADLPGVHEENVDIQFDRSALTITGTRAATLPSKERAQLRVYSAERLSGSFSRSVRLPEHVDAEKIEATYSNGVLTITVPKSAGALPRKITVGTQENQRSIKG